MTAVAKIPTVALGNATKVPVLGLASWGWSGNTPDSITQAVKDAIDLGYRFFDTTPGHNEEEVGEAITAKIKEGVVKREELFLVGKLTDPKAFHKPEMIHDALMKTLRHLNVCYLDLYIIDCPEGATFSEDAFVDTWYEMEKLVDNFLVKSIGLANFDDEHIKHLLNGARFPPVMNELECPPNFTQKQITNFCRDKRIYVAAYNNTASSSLIDDPMIMSLAKKYNKTPELILLRYQIDMGHIELSPLQSKPELKKYLEIFNFELSKSDLAAMEKLDRRTKTFV